VNWRANWRAYVATFAGAFLITLIYSTKPDADGSVTIARSGDTALVVDTVGPPDAGPPIAGSAAAVTSRDSLEFAEGVAARSTSAGLAAPAGTGSAEPSVVPEDLVALRAQAPVVPVAGVAAKSLVDSFDDFRGGTRRHNALDIMAARNTPAVAATSGRVVKLHNSAAGGLTVYLSDATSRFVLVYGHLDGYRQGLREGAAVRRGEIIGFVGSTGNANPLAPHLHFQITRNDNLKEWWKGTALNPFLIYRPPQ